MERHKSLHTSDDARIWWWLWLHAPDVSWAAIRVSGPHATTGNSSAATPATTTTTTLADTTSPSPTAANADGSVAPHVAEHVDEPEQLQLVATRGDTACLGPAVENHEAGNTTDSVAT